MNMKPSHLKIAAGVLLVVLLTLCGLFYLRMAWFVSPDRDMYPVRGIDVARYQGDIDWNRVANDDVSFAYVKATEADDFKDVMFSRNIAEAKLAGLRTGAYHFYSLRYGGEVQARNFIETVSTTSLNLPPVIDLEYVGNSKARPLKNDFQGELKKYIDLVSDHYGSEPVIYTTYDFYDDYLYPEYKDARIWIRDVFSKPNEEISSWTIWQYNPRGRVDGIEGPVDLNVFNSTTEKFAEYK